MSLITITSIEKERNEWKGAIMYNFKYKDTDNYSHSLTVVYGPTCNCQMFSIRNFDKFAALDLDSAKRLLKEVCLSVGKGIVLIDIKDYILNSATINKLFEKAEIIVNQPYESTNGSEMVLMMIKTSTFKK